MTDAVVEPGGQLTEEQKKVYRSWKPGFYDPRFTAFKGIEQGFEIVGVKVPTDRINAHWFYIPGLLLAALVWWLQGLRMRRGSPAPAAA